MSKFSQYMSDAEREYDDLEESNDKLQNRVKELEEEIEEEKNLGITSTLATGQKNIYTINVAICKYSNLWSN